MGFLKSQIEPHLNLLEQNGKELLAIYQDAHTSVRSTPTPNRWQTQYVLQRPDLNYFHIPSAIDVSSVLDGAR